MPFSFKIYKNIMEDKIEVTHLFNTRKDSTNKLFGMPLNYYKKEGNDYLRCQTVNCR